MATLGVLSYGDQTPHKPNVLQQSPIANSANVDHTKRQIVFLRKPGKPLDPPVLLTNVARRPSKDAKDMRRLQNPPPVAVARRNARERNRVKQVNNGFATLRQHIPTFIAAAYESGTARGSNKKLSKVETLRMAVEYIKSLEKLLTLSGDEPGDMGATFGSGQAPTSADANLVYAYQAQLDDDETSSVGSARHAGKTGYHLMDAHMYEDEENVHPVALDAMDDDLLQDAVLVNGSVKLADAQDISLLHSIDNNASLSPEMYSEHSLSPAAVEHLDSKSFIPVFNVPEPTVLPPFAHIGYERMPHIKSELLSPNTPPTGIDSKDVHATSEPQTLCVISRADVAANQRGLLPDVLWWDQHAPRS